jgi:RNA:NAD 2'-phosphotransferase (TPT1/KptA family)
MPKRLRLPAGKNTHEHMGRIVRGTDPSRFRVRGVKLRAGEELSSTIVVKPSLARLEARDYRVTRSRVTFRCMLIAAGLMPSLSDFIGSAH